MGKRSRFLSKKIGLAMGLALVMSVAVPGVSTAASPPLFTQCHATGPDTGCGVLITVNADGSTTSAVDPGQPPLSADAVLVGVVNNTNATLNDLALTSATAPGSFAFVPGEGLCAIKPNECKSKIWFGPTGYEGPGVSFTVTDPSHGTVNFAGGLSPGLPTYFSLRSAPTTIAASLQAAINVTTAALTSNTNVPFSGTVATFADGDSTAPPTEFTATTSWGDGSATSTSAVSQPGGSGTPYVVTDSHTYGAAGLFPVTVTVTDTVTTAIVNQGSDTVDATVVTQPVVFTGAAIADQVTGTPFAGTVATFTEVVPGAAASDFTASIDWGAQSGNVEQISAGTVAGPTGPNNQFTVTGSNTYTASGPFTIQVTVTYQGVATTIGVPIVVDFYQAPPLTCTGTCTSVVPPPPPPNSPPPLQTSTVVTKSTVGTLTAGIADGTLDCGTGPGGIGYDHAPQITTEVTAGIPSSTLVKVKVTFLRSNLVLTTSDPADANIGVCFEANTSFAPATGWSLQTLQVPVSPEFPTGQAYLGLLPTCAPPYLKSRPCVGKVSKSVPGWKTVQENIRFYAGDPRHI